MGSDKIKEKQPLKPGAAIAPEGVTEDPWTSSAEALRKALDATLEMDVPVSEPAGAAERLSQLHKPAAIAFAPTKKKIRHPQS